MKLRKMTSAGMMDCKKALAEAEGDFEKAVNIIREKGKLVAAKRADRETSEGAVLVRIQGTKGVIVCLGCETDFVSATPDFKALAAEIADAAIASFPADIEGLKASKCSNGHTVEEEISPRPARPVRSTFSLTMPLLRLRTSVTMFTSTENSAPLSLSTRRFLPSSARPLPSRSQL